MSHAAHVRLRIPRGTEFWTRWICRGPIEGLIEAAVVFCREPNDDEMITLDEFELRAGPDDYLDGFYRITGTPARDLTPGTYRPVAARVRVREHPRDVFVDLGHYSDEFSIVVFDASPLATPIP